MITPVEFHQHCLSLDTGSVPENFQKRELELGTGYLTTTDHGSMAGCIQIYKLAKKENLKPILGVEGYLRDDNCPILTSFGIPKDKDNSFRSFMKYQHFTFHYKDQTAYEAGGRILSKRFKTSEKHGAEYKPIFTWSDIEELGQYNVTIGSGCLIGVVSRFLLDYENIDLAIKYYEKLRSCAKPGNFFVEIFPHDCSKNWVKGIFLTLEDGKKIRVSEKKKLLTNAGEIDALSLVKEFKKEKNLHKQLRGIRNRKAWDEIPETSIKTIEYIEDYLPNECTDLAPDGDIQKAINKFMIELAAKYNDPVVISGDSHYAYPNEKIIQDIKLGQNGSWKFYGSYHRKSGDETFEFFKQTLGMNEKQFENLVNNNYQWASNFDNFKLEYKPEVPAKFFPSDTLAYCKELINKHGRMDWNDPVRVERLEREIKLFKDNGVVDLLPYFFVGEKICSFYESLGKFTGPGRGSAGGVYLNYCLGITHSDPIDYDLSLDRFITLDRILAGKWPDIDFDFYDRDVLLGENGFLETHFKGHYAQISTINTLKAKGAVKDVFRALYGKVPEDVEMLTKNFTNPPQGVSDKNFIFGGKKDDGTAEPGSIETDPYLKAFIKKYPKEWEIASQCLSINRSFGRHAAGYCITNRPIEDFIPTHTVGGITSTQYTLNDIDFTGAIKFDFLVISTLKDLIECVSILQEGKEIPNEVFINNKRVPRCRIIPFNNKFYDIWDLPKDLNVYEDIIKGKTETVFQLDADSARRGLTHFNFYKSNGEPGLSSIDDLAIFTSLDRPGGLDGEVEYKGKKHNILVEFARRAKGEEPAEILPEWEELFPETYNLCVFQEQLTKAYQHFTGCTRAEAEAFRGYVGKKQREKIEATYPYFMDKCSAKLSSRDKAQKIWDLILAWAEYGFNRSHAVDYMLIAYACAFLKHHFNLQWWTAVLRNADKDKINERHWRHCGYLIDLPDIKYSKSNFAVLNNRIQAPISLIHGIGETAHKELCDNAPYNDLADFLSKIKKTKELKSTVVKETFDGEEFSKIKIGRSSLNRGIIYKLIVSGAMDSLFPPEFSILDKLEMYEQLNGEILGGKKQAIDPKFLEINQLKVFQLRKQILQCYSAPLLPMLYERKVSGIIKDEKNNFNLVLEKSQPIRFVDADMIKVIENVDFLPKDGIKIAVASYVEDFADLNYTDKTTNKKVRAGKLFLDINGSRFTFIKWPDRKTRKIPDYFNEKLKGAIVVCILNKYKEDRPFNLEDLYVIQPQLQD